MTHDVFSLRVLGPDIEEFEPQAARLAVDLGLDSPSPVTSAASPIMRTLRSVKLALLYLVLSEVIDFEPARLGISDGAGVGVEKLIACKRLPGLPVPSGDIGYDAPHLWLVFQLIR
jgi:hypothetical protein